MKKKQKPKKENSERWLLTYSDLITLLMILFILLFALSNISESKYQQLSESLNSAMGQGASIIGDSSGDGIFPQDGSSTPIDLGGSAGETGNSNGSGNTTVPSVMTPTPEPTGTGKTGGGTELSESLVTEQDMKNMEEYVNNILQDMNLGVSVGTSMMERGLSITFKNDVFFDSGKDELKDEMKKSLHKIAILLNRVDNAIVIEGHTDNVPISRDNKFSSNWQLSAARASNVAEYLVDKEHVDGTRVCATGYGEYKPVASNKTAKGRSENRRVDIIILYDSSVE